MTNLGFGQNLIIGQIRKTFDNFVTAILTAIDEAKRNNLNKLGLLTSFLSYRTFELVDDATEYDQARAMLRNAYHKPKNVVFERHLLISRTRNPARALRNLSTL